MAHRRSDRGATTAEFGIIAAVIAVIAVGAVSLLEPGVRAAFDTAARTLNQVTSTGTRADCSVPDHANARAHERACTAGE